MNVDREVLVVEDEAVIRQSLKRLLERHRYRVSEAASVRESLDRFNVNKFDVIISDLKLPGAPGTDLIRQSSAPVLIMTSYSSIRSAIDSMKLGAVDYIAKPFDHGELLTSLDRIFEEHGRDKEDADLKGAERDGREAGEAGQGLSLEDYFQHFVRENQDSMTETELAKKLGISRKCLWERRQRLGMPRKKKQPA